MSLTRTGAGLLALVVGATVLQAGTASTAPSRGRAGAELTGFAWSRLATRGAPSVRVRAPAAYDPSTGQIVLFGGYRIVQPTLASPATREQRLGDTWAFARGTWTQLRPLSSPPLGTVTDVLAYDPTRRQLILVAAPELLHGRVVRPASTWTWTGTTWVRLIASGPRWNAQFATLAFDQDTSQLVFAPEDGTATSVLQGSRWVPRAPTPDPLVTMAYDPASHRLVGSTLSSMWFWNGSRWRPCPVPARNELSTYSEGAPRVTDDATGQIMAFARFSTVPLPLVHSSNLWTWLADTWQPVYTKLNPAPT